MFLGRPFSIYVKISQDWQKEKSSNHQKFLWILSPVFEKWFIAYITLVGFHGFGLTYKWRHLSIYGRHASNWCALCKPIDEHQCNACWWSRDRASDSLRSLVERSLPSGAAGPGSTSPHPPSFSQIPLFSFTICTDGYCPLKTDCDFYSANSWHPPMPVLRESTASTDQRIKCQIRIFLSQLQLHLSLA